MSDFLRIEECMRGWAAALNEIIKGQFGEMGFMLLVFPFNEPGVSNYISNAERSDMIMTLRETADRLEKNQIIPAVHSTAQ